MTLLLRKGVGLIAVLSLTSTVIQAKEWETIRFGVEGSYPPFSWTTTSGEVKGFDIDLANALCEELEAQCVFVPQDWNDIIPGLLANQYDAIIAAMSITDERKQRLAFTNKYAQIPSKFIALKGKQPNTNIDSFKGIRIAVLRGSSHDDFIVANYPDSQVVRYGNFDDIYLDLYEGKVDVALGDASALEEGILKQAAGHKFEFVGPALHNEEWFGQGMGIAVNKSNPSLVKQLNAGLDNLHRKGIYRQIQKAYFNYDIHY
ncbi:transporter substrate-binding domain-containing protein [Vibrio sp.]|nr:transporter substrate-binding domain-containing protein [Vibrio sp.]